MIGLTVLADVALAKMAGERGHKYEGQIRLSSASVEERQPP